MFFLGWIVALCMFNATLHFFIRACLGVIRKEQMPIEAFKKQLTTLFPRSTRSVKEIENGSENNVGGETSRTDPNVLCAMLQKSSNDNDVGVVASLPDVQSTLERHVTLMNIMMILSDVQIQFLES